MQFRTINIGKILYETVRNDFAIRTDGILSDLYKYCYCCIYPLQQFWDSYDKKRQLNQIVAYCKWQKKQLEYMLNGLFYTKISEFFPLLEQLPSVTSITIDQAIPSLLFAPQIAITETTNYIFAPQIGITDHTDYIFAPQINNQILIRTPIIFHAPAPYSTVDSPEYNALNSIIDQVKLAGFKLNENYFITT